MAPVAYNHIVSDGSSGPRTHLSALYKTARRFHPASAFLIPSKDATGTPSGDWTAVSYGQFLKDVETHARRWRSVLLSAGIPAQSIVGLWLGGITYADVLHLYGLSRAGYIPQVFTSRLPSSDVLLALLTKTGAKALIRGHALTTVTTSFHIPIFTELAVTELSPEVDSDPLPALQSPEPDDILFIYHTSGSTSGTPKLVHYTARWWDAVVKKGAIATRPKGTRQDVATWLGSVCHIGEATLLLGSIVHGSCIVQPTQLDFSSDELLHMIQHYGLNRLYQFSPLMTAHLHNAKRNPALLAGLQSLDDVMSTGLPLSREDEEWAFQNGLEITDFLGSTEVSLMMITTGGKGPDRLLFHPVPDTVYVFEPVEAESLGAGLMELVIPPQSPDCPHVSFRHKDGRFHTGDLYREVMPGRYVFCGRDDDWIKTQFGLRCNTRAIELHLDEVCGDLIQGCVVIGTGRRCPALFVEPAAGVEEDYLKQEILSRTREFMSRLYLHEQITDSDLIVVVPAKSLPRTAMKGNIRRQAVEVEYKDRLDSIYTAS